jgi:cob(I)alamin adenosyltransferase
VTIYTKRGDKGKTSLYKKDPNNRNKISKSDCLIHALGAIDELNSYLGVITSHSQDQKLNKTITDLQKDMFTIGSIIGGSGLRFSKSKTTKLEKIIDELEKKLPPLKNFILPGGSKVAAHLQYARSLARKAERTTVALNEDEKIRPQVLTYLNRLSDLLFMLARQANFRMGIKENVWIGEKKYKKTK